MILVDANLLIYAHVQEMPHHEAAKSWLDGVLNEEPRVGFPWPSLLAFVRLTTNPRIFTSPLKLTDAWSQVEGWLDQPSAWIPAPTEKHRDVLGRLLKAQTDLRGNLIPDAHLAALALEHGLTLYSADSDFARFPNLRWKNPLQ